MYIWLEYLTIKSHILFIVRVSIRYRRATCCVRVTVMFRLLIIEMETFKRFCRQCLHLVVIQFTCKSIHKMRL